VIPPAVLASQQERPALSNLLNNLQRCFKTLKHLKVVLDPYSNVESFINLPLVKVLSLIFIALHDHDLAKHKNN